MTIVLRLIRQARWDSPAKLDWLAEGDMPADPLADFAGTVDNALSVWFLDDDMKDLEDILAALAASREKADKLDYLLFREDHLKGEGIEVSAVTGQTPDEQVNGRHRDLTHLSAANVVGLTTKVWRENLGPKRIDAQKAIQLVAGAVHQGRMSLEKLRPKLREDVLHCLGDKRRKPK